MKIKAFVLGITNENTYVVSENKKALIIDPGTGAANHIATYLKENDLSIEAVLLTHIHFDHVDGLGEFKNYPVYVSDADASGLFDDKLTLYRMLGNPIPYADAKLDVHEVSDGERFCTGTFEVELMLTPGHTPGSACFMINETLFSGDTLFQGSVGRVDFPGGSAELMKESMRKLGELKEDKIVYPGHGEPTTIEYEKQTNIYMKS